MSFSSSSRAEGVTSSAGGVLIAGQQPQQMKLALVIAQ